MIEAPRWWTVEEANAVLPRVGAAVDEARRAMASAQGGIVALQERAATNGHGRVPDELPAAMAVLAGLRAEGIVVRDLDQGLVDFPARSPGGRHYWLCWLVGEPAVAWWHWPEDGFAGRTPITEPPE